MRKIESGKVLTGHLTYKAAKSVIWAMTGNMGVSAIRFVGTMILARILAPEEFGIVGMALLIMGIIELFGELGMGAALIQKKEIDDAYLSTAFWATNLVGIGLAILTVLVAPLTAIFFKEPVLNGVVSVLSINFVMSSFGSTHATILTRNLKFRRIARIEITSAVLRIIAIVLLALNGFGFWSIILGNILDRTLKTVLLWFAVKWSPEFQFHTEKFHELFKFGKNLYGQYFVNYMSHNIDYLITGRVLGASNLALYQFAYNIPHLVLSHISESVSVAVYPIYCKVQDDLDRLYSGYLKSVKLVAIITFPLMGGLAFSADDFIISAYGERWSDAILPLRILCLSAMVRSVFSVNHSLLNAQGRPDIGFKWGLFILPVTVGAIYFGAQWGIVGVAASMVTMALLAITIVYIGVRLVKGTIVDYIKTLGPACICTAIMIINLYIFSQFEFINELSYIIRLFVNIVIGFIIYVFVMYSLFKSTFMECKVIFVMFFGKRKKI